MTRKIKLLVDGHLFDGMYQGSRTFLKGLYMNLANSDHLDISIAANDLDNLEQEFSDISGSLNFIRLNSHRRIPRLLFEFPTLIRKHGFDYAHFQYIDPPVKACRTIITIHDVLFLEFVDDFSWAYRQKKHLFKLAAKRADILTTDSEYSRQAIHRYLDIPLNDIDVIRPALEAPFFAPATQSSRDAARLSVQQHFGIERYILYVSRIEPRKNHIMLLRSYLELQLWKQNIHLIFVGKDSIECKPLKAMLASIGEEVKPFLHHYEKVEHGMLIDLFRAASISVYPTRAEGFGYPPLEAAALGTETLTSDATCLSEFEFFGERFFDPDNIDVLKGKLSAILSDSFDGPDMGSISRYIHEHFAWKQTAEKMESLICRQAMEQEA